MASPSELMSLAVRQARNHAIALLDTGGVIVAWEGFAESVFGYSPDEILGRHAVLLFTPEDIARGVPAWERRTALESGDCEDDRWMMRKDGARIWVGGSITALYDAERRHAGFVKIMRDRTEQKTQVEALEARVATLQRSERQRIEFVSTLAHELRNPLGTISNSVFILDKAPGAGAEVRFAASVVRRQTEFMTRLVDDLIELARSATGRATLNRERVVLQDVVARSLEACRASIEQRAHQVHALAPEGAIELQADPMRLQQVFTNLIQNASKYTPDRGTIWIKSTIEGDEAVVHVRDTGVGISAELMPHIFELFTQGEGAARAGGGLGIGLTLVKEVVELHGGTVQATSDGAGKGSEFTVRLPVPGEPRTPGR